MFAELIPRGSDSSSSFFRAKKQTKDLAKGGCVDVDRAEAEKMQAAGFKANFLGCPIPIGQSVKKQIPQKTFM